MLNNSFETTAFEFIRYIHMQFAKLKASGAPLDQDMAAFVGAFNSTYAVYKNKYEFLLSKLCSNQVDRARLLLLLDNLYKEKIICKISYLRCLARVRVSLEKDPVDDNELAVLRVLFAICYESAEDYHQAAIMSVDVLILQFNIPQEIRQLFIDVLLKLEPDIEASADNNNLDNVSLENLIKAVIPTSKNNASLINFLMQIGCPLTFIGSIFVGHVELVNEAMTKLTFLSRSPDFQITILPQTYKGIMLGGNPIIQSLETVRVVLIDYEAKFDKALGLIDEVVLKMRDADFDYDVARGTIEAALTLAADKKIILLTKIMSASDINRAIRLMIDCHIHRLINTNDFSALVLSKLQEEQVDPALMAVSYIFVRQFFQASKYCDRAFINRNFKNNSMLAMAIQNTFATSRNTIYLNISDFRELVDSSGIKTAINLLVLRLCEQAYIAKIRLTDGSRVMTFEDAVVDVRARIKHIPGNLTESTKSQLIFNKVLTKLKDTYPDVYAALRAQMIDDFDVVNEVEQKDYRYYAIRILNNMTWQYSLPKPEDIENFKLAVADCNDEVLVVTLMANFCVDHMKLAYFLSGLITEKLISPVTFQTEFMSKLGDATWLSKTDVPESIRSLDINAKLLLVCLYSQLNRNYKAKCLTIDILSASPNYNDSDNVLIYSFWSLMSRYKYFDYSVTLSKPEQLFKNLLTTDLSCGVDAQLCMDVLFGLLTEVTFLGKLLASEVNKVPVKRFLFTETSPRKKIIYILAALHADVNKVPKAILKKIIDERGLADFADFEILKRQVGKAVEKEFLPQAFRLNMSNDDTSL